MEEGRRPVAVEIALQPTDLGGHVGGIAGHAGQAPQPVFVDDPGLGLGAAVHPNQAGAERPTARVDRQAAIQLPGDAQGPDLAGGHLGVFECLADGGAQGSLPQLRVLFGPSRPRIVGRIALGGATEDAKVVRVRDRGLQALRADIDADDGDGPPPVVSGRQAAAMRIS